jgi:hypothetical protein
MAAILSGGETARDFRAVSEKMPRRFHKGRTVYGFRSRPTFIFSDKSLKSLAIIQHLEYNKS